MKSLFHKVFQEPMFVSGAVVPDLMMSDRPREIFITQTVESQSWLIESKSVMMIRRNFLSSRWLVFGNQYSRAASIKQISTRELALQIIIWMIIFSILPRMEYS